MRLVISGIIFFGFALSAVAQSAHQLRREGDEAYKRGDFQASEEAYRKADLAEKSKNGTFNLGNSIYQQERFEEAVQQYENVTNDSKASDTDKSDAYHNLGNAYYNMQQFDKSVDAFKESLKLNPDQMETKYNLSQALRQLRIQQQQEQQQQQQDQEEQQEEQQDQEQQQQQEQDQEQEQPQEDQQQQDEQQQQEQDLNKEEARKLLEIMEQEEKKVQEKLKKAQKGPNKSKKDW